MYSCVGKRVYVWEGERVYVWERESVCMCGRRRAGERERRAKRSGSEATEEERERGDRGGVCQLNKRPQLE